MPPLKNFSEKKLDIIIETAAKTVEDIEIPVGAQQNPHTNMSLKETRKYRSFINEVCDDYDFIKNDTDLNENPFILEEVMQRVENFVKNKNDEDFKRKLCFLILSDYWDEVKFHVQYDYILSTNKIWKKFTKGSVLRTVGHSLLKALSLITHVFKKK